MIPAERAHLNVAAATHPGMSGKNNEDRYAVSTFYLSPNPRVPVLLAVVSDGIGGHRAGEVAAEMAVTAITEGVKNGDPSRPEATLHAAIVQASQQIYEQAEADPSQKGMGATCACAWIIGDQLYTATVGDSRIYWMRAGQVRQISTDHTWIQEALESGVLSPEEARGHPNSHVIRRYLGSRQTVVPDFRMRINPHDSDAQAESNQGLRLQPGDQLLLCSDGLTDLVSESEILAVLQSQEQEAAVQGLVELANQRGGHDNITIISLKMPQSGETIPGRPAGLGKVSAPVDAEATLPTLVGAAAISAAASSPSAEPTVQVQRPQPIVRSRPADARAARPPQSGRGRGAGRTFSLACLGTLLLVGLVVAGVFGALWYFNGSDLSTWPLVGRFFASDATPTATPALPGVSPTSPTLTTPGTAGVTPTPAGGTIPTRTPPTRTPLRPTASPGSPPTATLTPWPASTASP